MIRTPSSLWLWLFGLGLLLFLTAATLWWAWRQPPPELPVLNLNEVDPAIVEVLQQAEQGVRTQPRSASAWGHLGMLLRAHSFAAEANYCFQQAEQLDSTDSRWPYYRGLTLVLTEPTAGIDCLQRAVHLQQGEYAPAVYRLVEVLLEQGRFDEADHWLQHATQHWSDEPRGRLLQARLAGIRQDWAAVVQLLTPWLHDPRSRKQAHQLTAEAQRRLGALAQADQLAELAQSLPDDLPAEDPYVLAVERLRVGLPIRLAEAAALEQQGQVEAALTLLQHLSQAYPTQAAPVLQQGLLLRRLRRYQLAEQALHRAVTLDPDSVEARFALGTVRVYLGQLPLAIEAFQQVVRRKPDHTLAWHNLGICHKQLGDRSAARRAWETAVRIQPDYAPSRAALEELNGP